jgi:hypothetical protein
LLDGPLEVGLALEIYHLAAALRRLIVWAYHLQTPVAPHHNQSADLRVADRQLYLLDTLVTPRAARNLYEQQYPMHRFAVEYSERLPSLTLGG